MTLEQLTGDIETLSKMTDAQLEEFCKPFFAVTRPTNIPAKTINKALAKMEGGGSRKEKLAKFKGLQDKAMSMGVDLTEFM